GLLELAEMASGCAGERSFFVAEQFGFNQLRRNRGAVQRDERSAGPRTALMQRPRHQFFSRAGLAENADASFAGGYTFHLCHHAAHGLAFPYNLVFAEAALEVAILALEAAELERVLHGEQQFLGGGRFIKKDERAEARGAHGHLDVLLA